MEQIRNRNIVICCDGTGNQYGRNNTNVVKLFEMLVSSDDQKIFYDPGVGTTSKAFFEPIQKLGNLLFQALGSDLQRNVEDAYYYLMNVYQKGDQIFLFGFSRGAHTARRLASMLEKCGLLHRGSENMIRYASWMYLNEKDPEILEGFRSTFSRPCPVHFIGVWDTVSALSSLLPRPKLDGYLSEKVRFAYHAVAIDERRLQFPPNLWIEKDIDKKGQVVEQVWFAGVHSNVGGWYDERGLSNIALDWMAKKAVAADLRLYPGAIENIAVDALDKQHESWSGVWWFVPHHIYVLIVLSALLAVQLALVFAGHWWDLPVRPFSLVMGYLQNNWLGVVVGLLLLIPINKRSRTIPAGAKVHVSVKERWESPRANYRPDNLKKVFDKITWVKS